MNHLTEEQLVFHHYGDVGDEAEAAAIERHLGACPACQASLDEIGGALSAVDSLEVPERGDDYGAGVFARIQPSFSQRPRGWRERLGEASPKPGWILAGRRWAWAGAAAALFVAAFVAGRHVAWQRPVVSTATKVTEAPATAQAPPTETPGAGATVATPASAAAERPAATPASLADREGVRAGVLLLAVGDHLERSQATLSELVNTPSAPEVDISEEQARMRDLVAENRLYRQTAIRTGEPAVASVLDDLERVLVEVANGPSTLDAAEFDRVRRRIDQQGIIFKVRVFGERVREAETRPPSRAGMRG
jgi:hypothetical protein